MRRWAWVFAGPLLVGCSQVDALQQVSGGPLATVEIAADDVLLQKQIPLLAAPKCVENEQEFTCAGTTLDNKLIAVSVPQVEPQIMTITVGGEQIFSGPVQEVIEAAGERLP
ncbi:MAG: hypothetical protein MUD05_00045 [Candidatus Nanopelagicales bacterium]|nr:hypothetical protein [Candidatus Nanopelagicales bacterium]